MGHEPENFDRIDKFIEDLQKQIPKNIQIQPFVQTARHNNRPKSSTSRSNLNRTFNS